MLSRSRAHVQHDVRRADHVRVVLHDDDGVARVTQAAEHADQLADVTGVKSDARLIKDKQGVDKRGAQGRGEIDPLHLSPAQRA